MDQRSPGPSRNYPDRPPRPSGDYNQRNSGEAQPYNRDRAAHPPDWRNRRDDERNFRGHGERSRGGNYRGRDDQTHRQQDFRDEQKRSRSRSRDRQERNRSPDIGRQQNGIPYSYGSGKDRRNFEDRNSFQKSKQQERLEKFERMGGPSQEDLSKIPPYINPRAVNVSKVIEQQEKRKLLWGKKDKTETTATAAEPVPAAVKVWENVTFSGDTDGRVADKFKKLMGLKHGDQAAKASSSTPTGDPGKAASSSEPAHVNQDDLFRNLDRQYELARLSAHTQKGVGLGFGSR